MLVKTRGINWRSMEPEVGWDAEKAKETILWKLNIPLDSHLYHLSNCWCFYFQSESGHGPVSPSQ